MDGLFVSIWDGGTRIETPCKVNKRTKKVYDIVVDENAANYVEQLDAELVVIDGQEYPVAQAEDFDPLVHRFWY